MGRGLAIFDEFEERFGAGGGTGEGLGDFGLNARGRFAENVGEQGFGVFAIDD